MVFEMLMGESWTKKIKDQLSSVKIGENEALINF